jgi:hypothetical protein
MEPAPLEMKKSCEKCMHLDFDSETGYRCLSQFNGGMRLATPRVFVCPHFVANKIGRTGVHHRPFCGIAERTKKEEATK